MRMWMVSPELLCKKHLMGEHFEIHLHRHNFVKRHSISGRVSPIVLIEPESMEERHNRLAAEMQKRGYNHESPFVNPDLSYLPDTERYAKADITYNIADLMNRCPDCSERISRLT